MKKEKIRKKQHTPSKEELRVAIFSKMSELKLWREDLEKEIPKFWENFSNFVIFSDKYFTDKNWSLASPQIWECISRLFSNKSIALQGKIRNDDFRSPDVKIVYGESPWVEIIDNGIFYSWNIQHTMFCSGNVSERHRIAKLNCRDNLVVDMFAGIGYFTIPYLVHAKAQKVIACEWNPVSVEALKSNLVRNKVEARCQVLEGDVRVNCPRKIADHVNMGLIPSCEEYWMTAAEILNPSGGVIHVHGNVTSHLSEPYTITCDTCEDLLSRLSINVSVTTDCAHLQGFAVRTFNGSEFEIEVTRPVSEIKWKTLFWYIWSVHILHSFCANLARAHNCKWEIQPIFLHRVKAYAPHIDHLVLDISCRNLQLPST